MKTDPSLLEEELRKLQAAPLDEALLERLEASADGTWTELTQQETRYENFLREISPAKLPADFLTSLESLTGGLHFPVDGKLIIFPNTNTAPRKRGHRSMWGAAAAVAIIGAISALLVPTASNPNKSSQVANRIPLPASNIKAANFVPASFNRGLSEVHDEGVVWKSNNEPNRVMRVVYMDHVTLKDANGRTMEVEQPRVEYMLVPAKTD
ncbi:MAG: hypothetical protein ABI600_14410 [Luteolibacter sp.]